MSLTTLRKGLDYENNEKVGVAIKALQSVQRKLNAQQGILGKFKEIFETSQAKHNIMAEKASIVEEASAKAIERHKVCQ